MDSLYEHISEIQKSRQKAVLCTIVSTEGSVPRKIGAKMIVLERAKIFGTIGGGTLEKDVIEKAGVIIKNAKPQLISYNLTKDLGMACGGSVNIFIEPLFSRFNLYIFGGGHIGKALAEHLRNMNFNIYLIDDREDIFNEWDVSGTTKLTMKYTKFFKEHKINENTFIVIVTKNHESDKEVLEQCIKSPAAYIGMIGSKRKALEIRKEFVSSGIVNDKEFNKIDIPIGTEIQAEGPEEIAISIAGKLILEKNKTMKLI